MYPVRFRENWVISRTFKCCNLQVRPVRCRLSLAIFRSLKSSSAAEVRGSATPPAADTLCPATFPPK